MLLSVSTLGQEEWLDLYACEVSSRIRQQQPHFLIELDVPDADLDQLFRAMSRLRPTDFPRKWSGCLTLASVHAAARADAQDTSFIALVERRLGRDRAGTAWQYCYGPLIRSWIKDQDLGVDLPEAGVAWSYVGCVYRHAGIPGPARAGVMHLVAGLLEESPILTPARFEEILPRVTSTVARRFLESEAGYRFVAWLCDRVWRLRRGAMSETDLNELPEHQRALVLHLKQALAAAPRHLQRDAGKSTNVRLPFLALDEPSRRLVVRFDTRGVQKGAYRTDRGVVPATTAPPGIEPMKYRIEPDWKESHVCPWWAPGESDEAIFRVSDGAFLSSGGDVNPGEYFLVTRVPDRVPQEIVLEEGGCLEVEGFATAYYTILRVEIPPDATFETSAFRSIRATLIAPQLSFDELPRPIPLGRNAFSGRVAAVRVQNWSVEAAKRYAITLYHGEEVHGLSVRADGFVADLPSLGPGVGEIRIERKSFARENVVTTLPFAVVPDGLDIRPLVRCAAEHETVLVYAAVPEGWELCWSAAAERIDSFRWRMPGQCRVVDGELRRGTIRIPIELNLPRVALHAPLEIEKGRVLWLEEPIPQAESVVEGIAGERYRLLLDHGGGTFLLGEIGELPNRGFRRCRLTEFHDALRGFEWPAGEIALQDRRNTVFRTRMYIASASRIGRMVWEADWSSAVFQLPRLGSTLHQVRELAEHVLPQIVFDPAVEISPVWPFLCDVALCAAEFDGTGLSKPPNTFEQHATEGVRTAIRWACRARAESSNPAGLVSEYPEDAVRALPLPRWRDALEALRADLKRRTVQPSRPKEPREPAGGQRYKQAERRFGEAVRTPCLKDRNDVLTRVIELCQGIINAPETDVAVSDLAATLRDRANAVRSQLPILAKEKKQ
jgi:hypothetical protein